MSDQNETEFVIPEWEDLDHTRSFSEEHIWKLAKRALDQNKNTPGLKCYVIVVSNPNRHIPMWKQDITYYDDRNIPYLYNQKVNEGLDFLKYHVFFITDYKNQMLAYDYNSTLEFPIDFSTYASQAINRDLETPRYFKVIDAQLYVDKFSSDRKHHVYIKNTPQFGPILNKEGVSNFETLIDMTKSQDEFGEVLNLTEFLARFCKPKDDE